MTDAEKVALKLEGKLKKYTVAIHWIDGRKTEIQTNEIPQPEFESNLRETIMIHCEENSNTP